LFDGKKGMGGEQIGVSFAERWVVVDFMQALEAHLYPS